MTPEQKLTILSIKNDTPTDLKIKGIEIYQAVIRDNVKNFTDFLQWRNINYTEEIIEWMP
jgi:hypothetical protein